VFTARYALSPYIKQIRFVFKALITPSVDTTFRQKPAGSAVRICPHYVAFHKTPILIFWLFISVIQVSATNTFFLTRRPMAQAVSRRPIATMPGLNPRPVRVGSVMDKVVLGQVFLLVLRLPPPPPSIIPLMLHTHLSNTDTIKP
jgi:hypothetical protein